MAINAVLLFVGVLSFKRSMCCTLLFLEPTIVKYPYKSMCAQIIPQKARPLSSFTNEEGMQILMGSNYREAETKPFALADLNTSARLDDAVIQATNLESVQDLLNHLGVDLALRCLHCEPRLHSKDYAKRELISPLLYVASILAGKLASESCALQQSELLIAC